MKLITSYIFRCISDNKLIVKSKFSEKSLTNKFKLCNLCINNYKTKHFTHCKKESRTYTANTESLHKLREGIERKFENGLGVLIPI